MTTPSNPFAQAEAWEVGTSAILAADMDTGHGLGNHLCTITEVDGSAVSGSGSPTIIVKTGNSQGDITNWLTVLPQTIGKVVNLTDAAGIDRPSDEQVRPDGPGFRLDDKYLQQLIGKQVGVIVRKEKDNRDPTKPDRDRVKGYVEPDKLSPRSGNGSDVTPASAFQPTQIAGMEFASAIGGQPAQTAVDDDIPF